MANNVLKAEGLVCYRGDQRLFTQLGFEVQAGQLLLIEGANGSGKTSLLKLIAGLRYPDEGQICWNGQTIDKLGYEYCKQLAYVGHQDGIKRELTVTENLCLLQKMFPQRAHTHTEILEQLHLTLLRDNLAGTLSAGQRRRIALARVLYSQASLWVLDEPFTALDKHTTEFIELSLQDHLHRGGLAIMTSHQQLTMPNDNIQYLKIAA